MFPWKKIICPTDFSDGSLEALAHATRLALNFKSELYIVHVLPTHPETVDWKEEADVPGAERLISPEAEEKLRKLTEPLSAKGIKTNAVILHGHAAEQVVHLAKEEGADLIVIATHGATGWRHLAFGSVTEKVVRMAMCPVLIVRMGAAPSSQ
ncbi:MAG: universal stress protein [Candidatus Korobacteraceae bacterium]|jgi:nucleotide-binding universal stress UspA family protein